MYSTGFSMETDRIAEPVDGPSAQFLVEQARAHGVWVCGSVPERRRRRRAAVEPARARRARRHDPPLRARSTRSRYGREHEHYAAGDELPHRRRSRACALSFFVCYDLRFADEFWALAGDTDCYVVAANWPATRREHWTTLLRARAIENQAYVVGVNRVGSGDGLDYAGDSAIIGPFGDEVVVGDDRERVLVGEVDSAVVSDIRARFPFLVDRR